MNLYFVTYIYDCIVSSRINDFGHDGGSILKAMEPKITTLRSHVNSFGILLPEIEVYIKIAIILIEMTPECPWPTPVSRGWQATFGDITETFKLGSFSGHMKSLRGCNPKVFARIHNPYETPNNNLSTIAIHTNDRFTITNAYRGFFCLFHYIPR